MIEKIKWSQILTKVSQQDNQAYDAIASLCDADDEIYLFRYPFGANIIDENGYFTLPNGEAIHHADELMRSELGYHQYGIPFGFLLSGYTELYLEELDKISGYTRSVETLGVCRQGDFIGLDSLIHQPENQPKAYQMVSGVRTAFVVPGIRNVKGFERLHKTYQGTYKLEVPNSIQDHGSLFKYIANHKNFKSAWSTEILFFPEALAKKIDFTVGARTTKKDMEYLLSQQIMQKASLIMNNAIENNLWGNLLGYYNQYTYGLIEQAKTILLCGLGKLPVYHVCTDNEAGPFSEISDALQEAYQWHDYAPIIMKPAYLNWLQGCPGYYSMSQGAKVRIDQGSYKSTASDATKVKAIINLIMKRAKQFPGLLQESNFHQLLDLNVSFHHYDADKTQEMLPSEDLFNNNPEITMWLSHGKSIAYSNSFLRCCVKISR